MKNVSIRMPDAGPFGDTRFEASTRAIVAASFVKSPAGGLVDVVFTEALHRRFLRSAMSGVPRTAPATLEERFEDA